MAKFYIQENVYQCANDNDDIDFKVYECDFIAYHSHVGCDKIQRSIITYFVSKNTNESIVPIDYVLENDGTMFLIFESYLFAQTKQSLNAIISFTSWFKPIKHLNKSSWLRLFYDKNNICVAFDESCEMFCLRYEDDDEYDNAWQTCEEIKKEYIDDIFFGMQYVIKNDVLIVEDKWYCCDNDYNELYEAICSSDEIDEKANEPYTKIWHIIYANEFTLPIYLKSTCKVINCSNNPPNLEFSNNEFYGTIEELNNGYRSEPYNNGFGLYTTPPYWFI